LKNPCIAGLRKYFFNKNKDKRSRPNVLTYCFFITQVLLLIENKSNKKKLPNFGQLFLFKN